MNPEKQVIELRIKISPKAVFSAIFAGVVINLAAASAAVSAAKIIDRVKKDKGNWAMAVEHNPDEKQEETRA